jgi:hypothetical protein
MALLTHLGSIPPAVGSGEGFLIAAVLLILLGSAIGLYSRGGSEVDAHPRNAERGDTGGDKIDALDGDGELPGSEGRRFPSTRGTR